MTRRIRFSKNGEHYVLTYPDGASDAVIDQLSAWASDPEHPLDWFDAAFVSFAMGRRESLEMDAVSDKVYKAICG